MVGIPQGPEIYGIELSVLEPEKCLNTTTPPKKKIFSSKMNEL